MHRFRWRVPNKLATTSTTLNTISELLSHFGFQVKSFTQRIPKFDFSFRSFRFDDVVLVVHCRKCEVVFAHLKTFHVSVWFDVCRFGRRDKQNQTKDQFELKMANGKTIFGRNESYSLIVYVRRYLRKGNMVHCLHSDIDGFPFQFSVFICCL